MSVVEGEAEVVSGLLHDRVWPRTDINSNVEEAKISVMEVFVINRLEFEDNVRSNRIDSGSSLRIVENLRRFIYRADVFDPGFSLYTHQYCQAGCR